MRTLLDIPEPELEVLNALSKSKGVSRAESVRRAIKTYIESKTPIPKSEDGFGLWKDYDIDGLEFQLKIRSEWGPRLES